MKHKHSQETFPWREGHSIEFLIDGEQFFPAMLKAIEKAENYVLMEMYLFESGEVANKFINAFSNAALRGVCVQLLVDGYGAKALSSKDRERLTSSGVQLAFYNPLSFKTLKGLKNNLKRTHRKYLIIDGESVFVGGAGITDHFYGDNAWRETVVDIKGKVISDWHTLFLDMFSQWSGQPVPAAIEPASIDNDILGRLSYTSGGEKLEIKRVLLNRMNKCQSRVWFASAYFIPSRKVRKALRRAALRGNDVRLLLPGPITDHPSVRYASRRYYARLLRFGVRIYEYQGRFTHTKMVLVDDWYTIGSSNVDRWNFRWNLEANLEVRSKQSAEIARKVLEDDFQNCEEIHYKLWVNRSKIQRFKEWLWGKVDLWMTRNL
ncbi:phospholipase D-like domain-containing protein [Cocleimonas sp. KMM 6892]|uniref:phospholipase D-like domain-containing protein n=1 Tax=unclassified Cocleimonas TaxID=2639732 RepID=UPI002DB71B5E|nr:MULTISPECIES: phospholipase D-like domain-containing protein [unclassified Cocleimonas]MEB8431029.1 phospholipase D-like domain-containing protein [Cocleimonas sp. KMM 6892]MEC4714199.1 phospholipase D-like domain-containing protein [Cocleimonas sp. KMM 6895]MEC4743530.1 phospholipase D-like domain-containing protein [Cocleimonas sp. KMM 6896]